MILRIDDIIAGTSKNRGGGMPGGMGGVLVQEWIIN